MGFTGRVIGRVIGLFEVRFKCSGIELVIFDDKVVDISGICSVFVVMCICIGSFF